jgi:sRNA-binding protein
MKLNRYQRSIKLLKEIKTEYPVIGQDKPLAIGTLKRLIDHKQKRSKSIIRNVLHLHCTSKRYLASLVVNADRYNLDSAIDGTVTEVQAMVAKQMLEGSYVWKKFEPKKKKQPPPPKKKNKIKKSVIKKTITKVVKKKRRVWIKPETVSKIEKPNAVITIRKKKRRIVKP